MKRGAKSLSQKIEDLIVHLKKSIAEHKQLALDRKELEDLLKHTKLSYQSSQEEALRRERAIANENFVMQTSELGEHIMTLSRQLKDAEQKMRAVYTVGTSSFLLATGATLSSLTATLDVTPTPLPTPNASASRESSPTSAHDDVASVIPTTRTTTTPGTPLEYMDAADANNQVIYLQHLHTINYILKSSNREAMNEESFLCRWPDEWKETVEAVKRNKTNG